MSKKFDDINILRDIRDELLYKESEIEYRLEMELSKQEMLNTLIEGISDVIGEEVSPLINDIVHVFEKEDKLLKGCIAPYTNAFLEVKYNLKIINKTMIDKYEIIGFKNLSEHDKIEFKSLLEDAKDE